MWYGQDMIDDYAYAIDGPIIARNVTDLYNLTNNYTDEEIVRQFEKIFLPRSNLSVYQIVNIIYIMRSLLKINTKNVK